MKYRNREEFESICKSWGPLNDYSTPAYGFRPMKGESSADCLIRLFSLDKFDLYRSFSQLRSGDGGEEKNILKLLSSALLGLLFFYNLNSHPIILRGKKYSKVFFEVKNVVNKLDPDKLPSNVDIALVELEDNGSARSILFLESKLCEPLSGQRVKLKEIYSSWLDRFNKWSELNRIGIYRDEISRKNLSSTHSSTHSLYCDGIKQIIAHIIGIINGPSGKADQAYKECYESAGAYQLGTILLSPKSKIFDSRERGRLEEYIGFYRQFADIFKTPFLSESGKTIELLPEPFLYSSVSDDSPLTVTTDNERIRELYGL